MNCGVCGNNGDVIGLKCKLRCVGYGRGFLPAQHFRSNSEVFGNGSDLKTLPGYSLTDFAVPRQLINEMKKWRCMIGLKCKLRCYGCGRGFSPA